MGIRGTAGTSKAKAINGEVGASAVEQLVIVAEPVACAAALAVEGHARNDHQIQVAGLNAFIVANSQLGFRLQYLVHADGEFIHILELK